MALIRWSKCLKAVGLIKIILFPFRRVQNKRVNLWNIGKTALKFWVLSIGKSGLKFWNRDNGFCCKKWRAKTDFDADFDPSSRKNAKHKNSWDPELDLLIEIHLENGFLSVENRFWISCFNETSAFPISKSKSRFATVKYQDFSEHGVFSLIGLDLLSTQFLSSHVEMADELPWI